MRASLLLVDLQRDFLAAAGLEPPALFVVERAAALLRAFRREGLPVVHVWTTVDPGDDRRLPHWRETNRWICVAGAPGHQPPEPLVPLEGEDVVHKTGFNPFASGTLEGILRRSRCDAVVVAGLHLHACVRTAAVECLERGWAVWIASDAVASDDPLHAESTRRWLSARAVRFSPVSCFPAPAGAADPPVVHRSPRELSRILFEVPVSGAAEVAAAAGAAREASAAWRRVPHADRLARLSALAERLDRAAPGLAAQMAVEIGKPIEHGREETRRAAANVRDVIRRAAAFDEAEREPGGLVRHRPCGVVALISPWNNPLAIAVGKIAPALAYANTVVWKPAPAAHRITLTVLELLRDSGVPGDVVRMVSGDASTGRLLAADPNVAAVTHTGSRLAGYATQEICSRRAVPLQAELSGNNAAIVWDDADLAGAATQVTWGAFGFAGQRCTANRRVIVTKSRFEEFLSKLKEAAERLPWGDPLNEGTEIGPVIDGAKRDQIAALVADAEGDADVHRVERPQRAREVEPWVRRGAYAPPVIVCCDRVGHALVQEETMGPLLVVQRADDFSHALALCNGVRHGLAAALFTGMAELQERFLEEVTAGILRIGSSTTGADVTLPFGGWKHSGLGPPEHGQADRLFYTRLQTVYGV